MLPQTPLAAGPGHAGTAACRPPALQVSSGWAARALRVALATRTLHAPLCLPRPSACCQVRPGRRCKAATQSSRHAQECDKDLGTAPGRAAQRPTPVTSAGPAPYRNPPQNARLLTRPSAVLLPNKACIKYQRTHSLPTHVVSPAPHGLQHPRACGPGCAAPKYLIRTRPRMSSALAHTIYVLPCEPYSCQSQGSFMCAAQR